MKNDSTKTELSLSKKNLILQGGKRQPMNKEKYNILYQRFINSDLPMNYTLEEITEVLKENFKAKEISKKEFLKLDPSVPKRNLQHIFVIDDPNILKQIFNEQEKFDHHEEKLENEREPEDLSQYPKKEHASIKMWQDIGEGKRLNVLLYKKRGKNGEVEYTLQGECRRLLLELDVLTGVNKIDIKDDDFRDYLDKLEELGRI